MKRLILLFSVSVLLTVQHLEAQTAVTDTVFLQLYNDSVDLNEVVVKGKRTPVANSRWSDMSPVELVTVGGANGDLYQALQTLPGTQVQGESGRLLVRGGSSDETQTYIDGMHVLNPLYGYRYKLTGTRTLFHFYVQWCQSGIGRGSVGIRGCTLGCVTIGDKG